MKRTFCRLQIIVIFSLFSCNTLAADSSKNNFKIHSEKEKFIISLIAEDLSHPWSLAFLPEENGLLITERPGRLLWMDRVPEGRIIPVAGIPKAAASGQGGLMDVVLSPAFRENNLVYLSFSEAGSGGTATAVAQGTLVFPPSAPPKLINTRIIYRAMPRSRSTRHFGSRLAFGPRGYLYVTLGERGTMARAQNTFDPYGSVLRLNADGSIPKDNPFASSGKQPGKGAPEIWAYGTRNAQGMAVNPATGALWLNEHGPKGGDEVNILQKGANYGWPLTTYGINYNGTVISDRTSAPGITDPVIHWTPSIAPSGMSFYKGSAFPAWNGNIFVGALAGKHLRRLELRGNGVVHQEILLQNRIGRIRDVRTGPDGFLYILTDEKSGGLYRITPE